MLHIATLLPSPQGEAIVDERILWEKVARPFLETLGYQERHWKVLEQEAAPESTARSQFFVLLYHTSPLPEMPPDMLLVLDTGHVIPGEMLDQCIERAQQLESVPPVVAMVHPQRNGFVLAAFHAATRMPVGVAFPSPSALKSLAAGLRRVSLNELEVQSDATRLQNALLQARLQRDDEAITDLLHKLGEVYFVQGRYAEASEALSELREIFEKKQDTSRLGRILKDLGQIEFLLQQWDVAEEHLLMALDIFKEEQDRAALAAILVDLGGVHLARKSYDAARLFIDESLNLCRQASDLGGEGAVLNNLAQLHLATGEHEKAAECLEQSLEITRALGEPKEELITLYNLAVTYGYLGRDTQASRMVKEARQLSEILQDSQGED